MFVWLTELTVAWRGHLRPGCRDYSASLFIRPEPFKHGWTRFLSDCARPGSGLTGWRVHLGNNTHDEMTLFNIDTRKSSDERSFWTLGLKDTKGPCMLTFLKQHIHNSTTMRPPAVNTSYSKNIWLSVGENWQLYWPVWIWSWFKPCPTGLWLKLADISEDTKCVTRWCEKANPSPPSHSSERERANIRGLCLLLLLAYMKETLWTTLCD